MESLESRCLLDASLSGRVFDDLNGNQRWEPNSPNNELALECWSVFLDLNNDGVHQQTEPSKLTGADGTYVFSNLTPGDYTVSLEAEPGFDRTTPIRFGETTTLIASNPKDHVFDPTRNVLYATSGDRILRRDPKTGDTLAALAIGTSLTALDITPDGKFLLVGEGTVDLINGLGSLYKINLDTNAVRTISFPVELTESGVFDMAAISNTRAFVTTSSLTSDRVALREVNLATNTVTNRTDGFAGGAGVVRPNSRLDRNASRSAMLLVEAQDPTLDAGSVVYAYDPATDSFPHSSQINASLNDAHVGISRDGSLLAIEAAGFGLKVLDDELNVVQTLTHFRGGVAFDPVRDILYAGDTTTNELVALKIGTWAELYRATAGEDLPDSGVYFEMQTSARAKFLSYTTPSGVRYIQLDRPVPHVVTVADNQALQNLDFGNWWNGENRRPKVLDNSYATDEDTTLQIIAPGVLGNDIDPDQDSLTATQQSSPQHGQLLFNADGSLTYTPVPDYFGPDSFTYVAQDAALQSCRAATVSLTVNSVNDAPTDIVVSDGSVDENVPGAELGSVVVVDPDTSDQHTFTLSDLRFEIVNGILKLRNGVSLDHEAASTIPLTITAFDNGLPSKSVSKTITITVNDVNEFDPTIDTTSIDTNEGSTTVGKVEVHDNDSSQVLSIAIIAGNDLGIFAIDPHTGVITVVNGHVLDHEGTATYVLTVSVTDDVDPQRTTTANVTIHVQDVNEFDPSIDPATFTIAENTPNGTLVGTVSATDQDTSQTLSYAITGGNTGNAFAINASGQITVADSSQLDFESASQFLLTVTATDNLSPTRSASAIVTINLTDVNEFNPTINSQTLSVPENAPPGTVVGTVIASDADTAQHLTFAITGGNAGNTFDIDSSSGIITVADGNLLNYESLTQIQLTVSVTDDGSPTRTSSGIVTIDIADVNEFSPDISDEFFEVDENTTVIGTVHATDRDTRQTITYQLVGWTVDIFAIDAVTGEIRVAPGKTLDFEQVQEHALTVAAMDSGSPSSTSFANVHVTVRDVNEFSPVVSDHVFDVPETAPDGFVVGAVLASDQDTLQTLNFAIIAGNEQGVFGIGSFDGHIFVANSSGLDRETTPQYTLTVEVTDSGNPTRSSTGTVVINVGDENEFPPTINNQSFSVVENSPNGTMVGTLVVDDPDATDSFTITILGGDGAGVFAVDSAGHITVANSSALDFESHPTYHLTVEVSDPGQTGGADTADVTIQILDANEFDPVLADQSLRVQENAPNGSVVGSVTATDGDSSQTVTYAITAGNASQAFAINSTTGQITVANSSALDFEGQQQFVLTVTATDNGNPQRSDSANVTITLDDQNESAPIVNNQSFEINENVSSGTSVGFVLARDLDQSQTLTYVITSGNTAGAFAINSSSGELTVANASAIDFETHPRFRLTVQVTDSGNPPRSSSGIMTIDVLDLNEPPTAILLDNNTVTARVNGALVGHVSVTDQDVNDRHTLTVDDSRFVINASRELRLTSGQSLNDNDGTIITLDITATDVAGNQRTQPFDIHVVGSSHPWQNPRNRFDVSDDGSVTSIDALLIINELNNPQYSDASGRLVVPRPDIPGLPYYDVNGDGFVTALDVLIIINRLNNPTAEGSGGGEGESGGDFIAIAMSSMSSTPANAIQDGASILSIGAQLLPDLQQSPLLTGNSTHVTSTRSARSAPASARIDAGFGTRWSPSTSIRSADTRTSRELIDLESALNEIAEDITLSWEDCNEIVPSPL